MGKRDNLKITKVIISAKANDNLGEKYEHWPLEYY